MTLTFKVADGADITVIPGEIDYETDGIYGSPKKPVIFLLGDTPTGMTGIDADLENSQVYDLQGRKVTDGPESGIRIKNGKKTLKK